jgi:4-hydroxybenzoate polyprenyltransferase
MLYSGGMMLNDVADVKWDRANRPERPLPSGRISVPVAIAVTAALMIGGAALCVLGAAACVWLTSALVGAIIFYDFLHKPWRGSVFVMGSCRTLLCLVAASAAAEHLNVRDHHEVIAKAIALGGYIVGITLFARHEAAPGKSSRWEFIIARLGLGLPPVVGITYVALHRDPVAGLFVLPVILVLGAGIRLAVNDKASIGKAVGLLLAGIVLVDALAVATVSPAAALAFLVAYPLVRLWQKSVAPT